MKIKGHFYEVTHLKDFATSYFINPKAPKSSSFKAAANIRVHLASVIPAFPGGFLPALSLKTDTNAQGSFSFTIAAAQQQQLKANKQAHFVAYRNVGSVEVLGQNITIYEPVYRSAAFDITKYAGGEEQFYFAPYNVPDSAGVSQAQVDAQVKEAKKDFKDIEKLGATLQKGRISVKGSGRGADIKFDIDLGVSTSAVLTNFLTGKLKKLDIDLPGPDFIVGLCVSKDDIEKQIEKGIAGIMKDANKTIEDTLITELAAQTGQSKATVKSLIESMATVTFSKLNYPVTDHKTIKMPVLNQTITIDIRSVVPKLSVGFPRNIS
jgi:hypothetical protein